jgi:PAS domain S-box-containing protein
MPGSLGTRTTLLRYGVAILATAVALLLAGIVRPVVPGTVLSLFYGAVAVAVWYGGIGPAILTAVVGYIAGHILLLDPPNQFDFTTPLDLISIPVFLGTSTIIIALAETARRSARHAQAESTRSQRESEERRAAEQQAKEANRRVTTILQSINECFFVLDHNWRFSYVNEAAERYFRRPKEALLGRVVWEEFPETLGSPLEANYHKAVKERVPVHFEVQSPVSKRWLNIHTYPSDEGLTVIFSDITRRKVAQEAAERSAAFLRIVADSAGVAIAYFDKGCRYRFVNRRYVELLGSPDQQAIGHTLPEVHSADTYKRMQPLIEQAIAGEPFTREIAMPLNAHGERHLIVTFRPDLTESGEVRGAVIAISDITDRVNAERALREADRRKDEFLAILAHELRNPLAPILNSVRLLRLEPTQDPQQRHVRDIVDRQVRHMARLVDDLLDVSRITLGRINLHRELSTIDAVIANAVEASRPLIDASRHELTVRLPPAPVYLQADVTRLAQVFLNLLNNAAKYTPPGGKILIEGWVDGEDLLVRVKDTGVGIPPEMLSHIFDIFTQVDLSLERTQGGLGIGLTLANRLVEMHGGTLQAHSEGLGKGSEFVVRLPVSTPPAHPERKRARREMPARQAKRRVLVVDDNIDAAESLTLLLQSAGHETLMAHDGIEAVEAAAAFHPDMVLLDIGLPRLNGYEAARRIRAQPENDSLVLAALTGWGQDEDKRQSLEAGFDLHLTKPVDPVLVLELAENPAAVLAEARQQGGSVHLDL